jgi:hypothetical protein
MAKAARNTTAASGVRRSLCLALALLFCSLPFTLIRMTRLEPIISNILSPWTRSTKNIRD